MFQNIPIEVIASWPPPNPHPITKVSTVFATEIILSVLLTIVVALRFISRIWVTRKLHLDDWLTIPAYICAMAFNIIVMISTQYGWGWHIWDIPISNWVTILKMTYVYTPVFIGANFSTKLSILLFYRRIFTTCLRFSKVLKYSIIFVILWNISFLVLGIYVCAPLHAYWNLTPIPGQRCYDVVGFESYGGIDVAVDLYLLLLFQWQIWRMKLELSKKVSIAFVMSFAGLAVAATVMRIPYILKACLRVDKTWDGMELTLWSSGELVLGIGCASAPSLRAYFTSKNRGILVGRLHSMHEWFDRGTSGNRTLQSTVDIEAGDDTADVTESTRIPSNDSEASRNEKGSSKRIDSIGSSNSGSTEKTRIGSIVASQFSKSPAIWETNELPWGKSMPGPEENGPVGP